MIGRIARFFRPGGRDTLRPGAERIDADEARIERDMIESIKAITGAAPGARVRRFNQAKTTACLEADFHVPDDLPPALRHGLFAQPGHYRAVIRLANASRDDDRRKDFRGMSIKVHGVSGTSLWGEDGTQDFLLNSHPALFAATPVQFLEFIEATRHGRRWWFFVKPRNWGALLVVLKGRSRIASPLDIPYYSTTPYRLGSDEEVAVKYAVRPCSSYTSDMPRSPGADFLAEAVDAHLSHDAARFELAVQFQGDPAAMPVEDASVTWDDAASPYHAVARITVEPRSPAAGMGRGQCEAMTFNPWQCLEAHRPLGGINRVRRAVYAELGASRNRANRETTAV